MTLRSLPALHPSLPVWRLWEGGTPFLLSSSTEGLGMEVLSDGVLNEQLGLLWTAGMSQDGWEGGRHFQDGGISRCNSSFISCVVLNVLGWERRLQSHQSMLHRLSGWQIILCWNFRS